MDNVKELLTELLGAPEAEAITKDISVGYAMETHDKEGEYTQEDMAQLLADAGVGSLEEIQEGDETHAHASGRDSDVEDEGQDEPDGGDNGDGTAADPDDAEDAHAKRELAMAKAFKEWEEEGGTAEELCKKHVGFAALKGKLAKKGAANPAGLAAFIGRQKYGKKGMAAKSAAGRK